MTRYKGTLSKGNTQEPVEVDWSGGDNGTLCILAKGNIVKRTLARIIETDGPSNLVLENGEAFTITFTGVSGENEDCIGFQRIPEAE